MLSDLKSAVSFMRRRRGFSTLAVLTLALGICANVTVLALVRAVLLAPQPYRASHEIFRVLHADHMARSPFQGQDLLDIGQIPGVARIAGCYGPRFPSLRTYPTLLATATEVTEDFFTLFDVKPHLGRVLQPADFVPGASSAVISFDLWTTRFGSAPDVVGQWLQLNDKSFRVVGVMPSTFAPPCLDDHVRRQAWIPFDGTATSRIPPTALSLMVRLRGDETLVEVQARLDSYAARRAHETGDAAYAGTFFERFGRERVRASRPGLLLLQALAVSLLLIACANIGSMFLLDANRRDLEFLTRAFIGASPRRLVRQLLVESSIIATIGSAMGVGLSCLSESAVRGLVLPILPRGVTYSVGLGDAAVGLFGGVLLSLVFAAFSAVVVIRRTREAGGRTHVQGTAGPSMRRFQDALVAVQIGLSVVLAVATTLIGLSYIKVATTDLALDAARVASSVLYLPVGSSAARAGMAQQAVADELRRLDGTSRVAFSDTPPFAGGAHARVVLHGADSTNPRSVSANVRKVTSNYFDVLSIPVSPGRSLAGRPESDMGEAVASASFARQLERDVALGQVVSIRGSDHPYRIIGLAADVPTIWLWQAAEPTLYIDLAGTGTTELSVLARTSNVAATTKLLQNAMQEAVPDAPPVAAERLAAILWRSEAEREFYLASVAAFALVAVVIGAVGIYTTVRYMVTLRTKEFAIRMAIGAAPRRLQTQVFGKALIPVASGIGLGVLATLWSARAVSSLEHASVIVGIVMRTVPSVVPTTIAVGLGALLLSGFACALPVRRTTRIDPALLLKHD